MFSYPENSRQSESGLSIIEVLFALTIILVSLAAFIETTNATVRASKRQFDRQDITMLRYFVRKHFDCNQTLNYRAGPPPGCPANLIAKTFDKRTIATSTGFNLIPSSSPQSVGQGYFKLKAFCAESISNGPLEITFKAERVNMVNPITGKLYSDPASLAVFKDALSEDVTQGNPVLCARPTGKPPQPPPPPHTSDSCTVSMIDLTSGASGVPYDTIPGAFFRSPLLTNDRSWFSTYGLEEAVFGWRVVLSGQVRVKAPQQSSSPFNLPPSNANKPDSLQVQFVNKDPAHSFAYATNGDRWNKKVVKKTGILPSSDFLSAMDNQWPGAVITLPANPTQQTTGVPKECQGKDIYHRPSNAGSGTIKSNTQAAAAVYCNVSTTWQSDISLTSLNGQTATDWYDSPVDMKITAIKGGRPIATCSTSFRLISPLALVWPELSDSRTPSDVRIRPSVTLFDLDGDTVRDRIGWVTGQTGFLAIDLNGNGLIDSGRELFGDATVIHAENGRLARHGFDALAQYDSNQDGIIDKNDVIFDRLMVWFDRNSDGETDPWEAIPLGLMGVTKLDLGFSPVKTAPRGQNPYVRARFESRFFAEGACEKEGCPLYDLYFAKEIEGRGGRVATSSGASQK